MASSSRVCTWKLRMSTSHSPTWPRKRADTRSPIASSHGLHAHSCSRGQSPPKPLIRTRPRARGRAARPGCGRGQAPITRRTRSPPSRIERGFVPPVRSPLEGGRKAAAPRLSRMVVGVGNDLRLLGIQLRRWAVGGARMGGGPRRPGVARAAAEGPRRPRLRVRELRRTQHQPRARLWTLPPRQTAVGTARCGSSPAGYFAARSRA